MAAILVTLVQAKDHLRITTLEGDAGDADIQLKLDQAEALILGRCGSTTHWRTIAATWTAETVPPSITAAILVLLTHLFEHRGDDMDQVDEALWLAVDRLVALHRDPVLA
jgi:hypothetical protein